MFYGFDMSYLILMIPVLILSMWASTRVKTTFNKYSAVASRRGLTGREAAEAVLRQNGVTGVRISQTKGNLTDHFDPRTNEIRLSESVYGSTSVAAIGVAAHEAGHAVQHAQGYFPIKLRNAIVPVTNIGSRLAMPLFLIGLVMSYYGEQYLSVAYAGIICFSACVLFHLVTLPTEFNASRRAVTAIEGSVLDVEETAGAKKVLSAAAMTYVAAMATALVQLLRLIMIVGNRRSRR